jgi:carbon storage regulator CsrA
MSPDVRQVAFRFPERCHVDGPLPTWFLGLNMHIFQRGVDESLVIGDDVTVTVLDVQPDSVRLGINDPNQFPAYWEETLYFNTPAGEETDLADLEYSFAMN